MELIKRIVLVEGYMHDGMSIKMFKTNRDTYKVYMYVHCEDMHEEVGEYLSYDEAQNVINKTENEWKEYEKINS